MIQNRLLRIIPISLALALAACGGGGEGGAANSDPLPKVEAPAGQQWSRVVRSTEEGFVMGNPDAPIQLVEYGSYTCHVCAAFSTAAHEELERDFVDTGRVSFELRPYVRDPLDLMLAATAMCSGQDRFFPLSTNIFAGLDDVVRGAQAAPNAAQNLGALPENQRFTSLARAWQVDQFFAARGVPAGDLNRCLSDMTGLERRQRQTTDATARYDIAGTPTFLLNGQVLENTTAWAQIKERLQAAGAR